MSAQDVKQTPDDERVLGLLQARDPRAAEVLVELYGDRVYGLALRVLGSAEDASEAVQETFLTALAKWETFKGRSRFSSWFYRLAANCACMKLRQVRRQAPEIHLEPGDDGGEVLDGIEIEPMPGTWLAAVLAPDQSLLQAELRNVIEEAVQRLPPVYRAAFILKDIEDLSLKDIAEVMGLSEAAVKSRVHRARLAMRQQLKEFLEDDKSRRPAAATGTGRQGGAQS